MFAVIVEYTNIKPNCLSEHIVLHTGVRTLLALLVVKLCIGIVK